MKNISIWAVASVLLLGFSCKDAKKETKESAIKVSAEEVYTVVGDSSKVSFTAYKTTQKVGVGGEFKKINLGNVPAADTPEGALDGLEFSIPVSSLFTNDATNTRDPKIIEFFFGAMADTEFISGTFHIKGGKLVAELTLNGTTAELPLEHTLSDTGSLSFTGVMDLKQWNASEAVAALNKACEVLHTGEDGVSKTWDEVAITGSTYIAH